MRELWKVLKTMAIFILSLILGFGFWYLIGYFISNTENILQWNAFGKIVYLLISMSSAGGIFETFTDNS